MNPIREQKPSCQKPLSNTKFAHRRIRSRLIRTVVVLALLLPLITILLSCRNGPTVPGSTTGTTTPATTAKPAFDSRLVGMWTNKDPKIGVSLDDQGKPAGTVPVGEWYSFGDSGNYFWVGRFMTFAVGGVSVSEGKFSQSGDALIFKSRTESFFPDKGSPQKEKYREPAADTSLIIRFDKQGDQDVLIVKTGADEPEVTFYRVNS
jgi:hypothetical protein